MAAALDAEHPGQALHELVVDRAGRTSGGAANASPASERRIGHEPGAALLHDRVLTARDPAGLEPRVAGPERGVPGERQLAPGVKIRTR